MKTLIAVALAATALAGCNTVSGLGKDLKAGGQAIERAAQ
nr:entericidin A/B family lipoprotein [Crenobacter luteus]